MASTRTALITGGTAGIGLHSAIGVAKTGATVVITGRNEARGAAAVETIQSTVSDAEVVFIQSDLSSLTGVDQLAAAVSSRFDRLDILVNNAGYFGDAMRHSDDGVELHFAVNVLAPWRLTYVRRCSRTAKTPGW